MGDSTLSARRGVEGVLHVGHDVVNRFATDTEPDEPLADCIAAPPGAPLRDRVHPAEARRFAHQRQRAQERFGARPRAEVEADERAERTHLPASDRVAGMRRQAGIVYGLDVRA